jgi:hypothetical protein
MLYYLCFIVCSGLLRHDECIMYTLLTIARSMGDVSQTTIRMRSTIPRSLARGDRSHVSKSGSVHMLSVP